MANMVTPTDPPAQPSRGIFSSIVGNMRRAKRSKNYTELTIIPKEPLMHAFLSGSFVTGHVRFPVVKSMSITHLALYLHGFVDVRGSSSNELPDVQPSVAFDMSSRAGKQQAKGGIVTLFEKEVILCNGGLLKPSNYLFQFNLQFPEDRNHRLPSCLNFERGSITYLLTARLTLPDNTVHSTNFPLKFLQRVDIGLMPVPEPLALYVEPWSKRRKKRSITGASIAADTASETASDLAPNCHLDGLIRHVDVSYDDASTVEHVARISHALPRRRRARSDRRSEASVSRMSSFSVTSAAALSTRSLDPSVWSPSLATIPSVDDRTITGEFELKKGGWMPGEIIPIHCFIQHVKPLQSARGLLVTLYREGRIDTSRTMGYAGSSVVSDDSWAALSNLSLSSNGSVSRFKKELCQTFTPLYIDPLTLSAQVVSRVKVPEEAFPTVEKLPADVLSFIYYAEILLDLDGRMSSQLHLAAQKSKIRNGASSNPLSTKECDACWVDNFWDTEYLRRIKGTVSIILPIIVGSMDSSKRGKQPARREGFEYSGYQDSQRYHDFTPSRGSWEEVDWSHSQDPISSFDWPYQQRHFDSPDGYPHPPSSSRTLPVDPFPVDMSDMSDMYEKQAVPAEPPSYVETPTWPKSHPHPDPFADEKDVMRSAEGSLFPSQPPKATNISTQSASLEPPPRLVAPAPDEESPSGPSRPSAPVLDLVDEALTPAEEQHLDDKRGLERYRLMVEASVPDEGPPPNESELGASWAADVLASAPFIVSRHPTGSGDSDFWTTNSPHPEPLPRYER